MKSLCIVPCGKKKIWDKIPNAGPTMAKNVYTGPFAKKCREYAKKFHPDNWIILSAKYGFLAPDDIISGPYNVSFNDKSSIAISTEELRKQVKEKNLDKYDEFVILGGKYYIEIIRSAFSEKEVFNPLDGCKGIGYMMAKLNELIKE